MTMQKKLSVKSLSQSLACAAVLLAVGVAGVPQAHAVSGCKADIYVTNKKPIAIRILKMEYKDRFGASFGEGLANKTLSNNEEEDWKKQRLEKVAAGTQLREIRFKYKNDTSGTSSGAWGPAVWTQWFPHSGDCENNKDYKHDIR